MLAKRAPFPVKNGRKEIDFLYKIVMKGEIEHGNR